MKIEIKTYMYIYTINLNVYLSLPSELSISSVWQFYFQT